MASTQEQGNAPWSDDLLGRKPYADFLTSYLIQKTIAGDGQGRTPFTFAIDAHWGQGKTFFITNWAGSLALAGHPTVIFDSWKADYANDPIVAFMAEFKASLDEKIRSSGLETAIEQKTKAFMLSAWSGVRRAIMPASKQIAKSLLHKATGIAIDQIVDAYKTDDGLEKEIDQRGNLLNGGLEAINKGLDTFFDKALEEHEERKLAIDDFRRAVESALQELVRSGKIALPMFVFIDELDRCRPSFAIALLEGIKHLFGIPGVCFVVTTNMTQLSHSIKAVYGEGFNGHGYLKRFFDVEASLPEAAADRYMAMLLKSYPIQARDLVLGLPKKGFMGDTAPYDATYLLTWVADVFAIDLRSQKALVEMIFAAMAGVPAKNKVFLLWLATLCAIKIKSSQAFELLFENRQGNNDILTKVAQLTNPTERVPKTIAVSHGATFNSQQITLLGVFGIYYTHQSTDLIKLRENFYNRGADRLNYPFSVLNDVLEEAPQSYRSGTLFPSSISTYFDLVKNAGFLTTE